ncbi:MAG: hypothetical protein ACUVUR_04950, partial [bacterium]
MRAVIEHKRWVFFLFAVLPTFCGCVRKMVRPEQQTVTVLVSGDLPIADLPRMANLISGMRGQDAVLWLTTGRLDIDSRLMAFSATEAEITMLGSAGVDGQVFNPEWLKLGLVQVKGLIDRVRCRILSANLDDTSGLPIAHPWFVKKMGKTSIGITAVLPDSGLLPLRLNGVRYVLARYAAKRVLALLRTKADFNILVLPAGERLDDSGYDLVLSTERDRISRFDLSFLDGRLNEVVKTTVSLDGVEPAPAVKDVIDSIIRSLEAIALEPVVESRVKIFPRVLSRVVVDGILSLRIADCILYDSSAFVVDTIQPGVITKGQLISAFKDPG